MNTNSQNNQKNQRRNLVSKITRKTQFNCRTRLAPNVQNGGEACSETNNGAGTCGIS